MFFFGQTLSGMHYHLATFSEDLLSIIVLSSLLQIFMDLSLVSIFSRKKEQKCIFCKYTVVLNSILFTNVGSGSRVVQYLVCSSC